MFQVANVFKYFVSYVINQYPESFTVKPEQFIEYEV